MNSPRQNVNYRKWRYIKDSMTSYLMAFGGVSVIFSIVLIAFYLIYVVIPMFKSAEIHEISNYSVPNVQQGDSKIYAIEEQREVALRLDDSGNIVFFDTKNGEVKKIFKLNIPEDTKITSTSAGDPTERIVSIGLSNGSFLLFQHNYDISYPDDVRLITPYITFPFGEKPIQINTKETPVNRINAQYDGEQATIVAHGIGSRINIISFKKETSFLSDDAEIIVEEGNVFLDSTTTEIFDLRIDIEQRELYVADSFGEIYFFNISDKRKPRLVQKVEAVKDDGEITTIEFLAGGISILVGTNQGNITQWFPVRDEENNYTLERIRKFEMQNAPVIAIAPEHTRKGFLAIDKTGNFGIYHTTAHRRLLLEKIDGLMPKKITIAPRANAVLIESIDKKLHFINIDNEHPEISFQSIWGKVWYESRDKPEYIWQSSSASSDFEPKFSLTPLAFGTLKAAFYAMVFAIPLSILGAIYTAYFMAPTMRRIVKPTIEIMQAVPTVILGFLAGLWLAPFVENYLPGTILLFLIVPLSIFLATIFWTSLSIEFKANVPEGWESAILIPVIILAGYISLEVSKPIENLFFNGNLPLWLTQEMGIDYEQRNSLIVGFAMGFAVIPTIFSISEDAIFGVPKHLTRGSLALGATTWQTLTRVILLTASPGIFSAIMIGLGRAVGETMIVVMATGNTAIMDMNIFEGFRALSANIAVEMPETEVDSTHYRILFLGALVLFIATFFFNTAAEVVRQRLRTKYSSL